MKLEIRRRCSDFESYRSARVKSLFNVETGADFSLDLEIPVDDDDWSIGLVVGPSGSGKTSIGSEMWGGGYLYSPSDWPADAPIIEAIAPSGSFEDVTGALSAVGLGSVPSWLRPYHVLSNGEKFRADLARIVVEAPERIVVDEFTSVVDRQIARIGALAFGKAWRRSGSKAVLLSCHYDIIDWLEPDWILDTATGKYSGRSLWRRPSFELEVRKTDWSHWPMFEPHHYLKLPRMAAAVCYVGSVDDEPVCHLGVTTKNVGRTGLEARACRLVVLPEWQGAGVGTKFLNEVCEIQLEGREGARLPGRRLTTLFHTSHPGLVRYLRRSSRWRQISCKLYGSDGARSAKSLRERNGGIRGGRFGGHFRAVQGFRYVGKEATA